MHYSPVRHSSRCKHPSAFDLHVLSIPPAFNLSHDQTLQFNFALPLNKISDQSWLDYRTSVFLRIDVVLCVDYLLRAEPPHIPTQIISILLVKEPGQQSVPLSRCILQQFQNLSNLIFSALQVFSEAASNLSLPIRPKQASEPPEEPAILATYSNSSSVNLIFANFLFPT